MRMSGRRKSDNVVNRKGEGRQSLGSGGMGGAGVLFLLLRLIVSKFGLAGIAVLVIGYFALSAVGINPLSLLSGSGQQYAQVDNASSGATDLCADGTQTEQFMCVVLASTEDVWNAQFSAAGRQYPEPELHIFSGGVQAGGCGYASAAVGPFYCPETDALYLDTNFFDELSSRFGAPGDFAQAYVVAHEVGHHIQNVTGTLDGVQQAKQGLTGAGQNQLQVKVELQADCLAGVWAHHENNLAPLDDGDIDEALTAANAIGDDTLQRQAGRQPVPDSFTHGTSAQRTRWFKRGYQTGEMSACDTFGASSL